MKTIAEKLANHAVDERGCWVWLGCKTRDGYGGVNMGRETLAHRASFRFHKGEIPAGTEIDHLCRNRACINPAHLEAVPHAVNVARGDYRSNHRNGRKTHCIHGHELIGYNVVDEAGARKCRVCRNRRMRELKARRRGPVVAL